MTHLMLLASIPQTVEWSPKIAIIMVISNVVAIALGKATIKIQNAGPALPSPALFGGFGLPAVLATTSFGHILGLGVILGLANLGNL